MKVVAQPYRAFRIQHDMAIADLGIKDRKPQAFPQLNYPLIAMSKLFGGCKNLSKSTCRALEPSCSRKASVAAPCLCLYKLRSIGLPPPTGPVDLDRFTLGVIPNRIQRIEWVVVDMVSDFYQFIVGLD